MPKGPIVANMAKALHTTGDYLLGQENDEQDRNSSITRRKEQLHATPTNGPPNRKADLVNAIFRV